LAIINGGFVVDHNLENTSELQPKALELEKKCCWSHYGGIKAIAATHLYSMGNARTAC